MRFLNKKGISPLIATVLLIGFTVALAGVVITWGGGFIKNITSSTEERTESTLACAGDLNFEITKVNCGRKDGVDVGPEVDEQSKITIDNKGSVKLESVVFRFFDAAGDSLQAFRGVSQDPNDVIITHTPEIAPFEVRQVTIFHDNEDDTNTDPNIGPVDPDKLTSLIPKDTVTVEGIATIKVNGQNVTCGEAVRKKTFTPSCEGTQ